MRQVCSLSHKGILRCWVYFCNLPHFSEIDFKCIAHVLNSHGEKIITPIPVLGVRIFILNGYDSSECNFKVSQITLPPEVLHGLFLGVGG
jgi:hypothetical protein